VELRAPRPRIKKEKSSKTDKSKKHFKLLLSRQSSPDWGSDSSIRTPLPAAPPELPKETKKATGEDSCTQDNWKSFYSYKTMLRLGDVGINCPPEEFDRASSPSLKSLSLMKVGGRIHLSIKSTFLQEQLRKVLSIEHFYGVHIYASEVVLEQPFGPLYHHVEEMKSTVEADTQVTAEDRTHMNALYYFATLGWPASLYKDLRSKISRGFIFYEDIWALFKPGDFVVTKDPTGHLSISKIEAVKFERDDRVGPNYGQNYAAKWWISLMKITCKSGRFRKISSRHRIESFSGAKRINELVLYPLSYHTAADEVRRAGIRRGKAWKKFCEGETRVMTYHGEAIPMVAEREHYGPPPSIDERERNVATASINSVNHGFALIHNRYPPQLSSTQKLRLRLLYRQTSMRNFGPGIIRFTMMALLIMPKSLILPRKTS
jgi:hypothetical protein